MTERGSTNVVSTRAQQLRLLQAAGPQLSRLITDRWNQLPAEIVEHATAGQELLEHAVSLFETVLEQLAGDDECAGVPSPLARDLGRTRAHQHISARSSMRAARLVHEAILDTVRDTLPVSAATAGLLIEVSATTFTVFLQTMDAAAQEHISTLMSEVAVSHATERRRTARDLHDQVGNALAVTHRQLELAHLHLQTGAVGVADDAVTAATGQVVETIRQVRSMLAGLRRMEQVVSLRDGLEEFVQVVGACDLVELTFAGDEQSIPEAVRREVFLILRETLRNALRHSGATHICLAVEVTPGLLRAHTYDNGRGMPEGAAGHGMRSLEERTTLLDGYIEWIAGRDGGTNVVLTVPLAEDVL